MKILFVHNYYGSSAPSGENKVFEAEKAMLEKHGHEVAVYTRHSDEIRNGNVIARLWGKVKGAMCTVGNPFAARAVAKKCREFKPDVIHFHNTFPLISPLAVRAASKYAPVVMTLHNYRTVCAAGVPTRDDKVCSLCLDKKCVWDGIKYRCYRGGLLATLPLAINIALYRRLLPKWVSRFIVLSEFQKRKMVEYGWPEEKIAVKGNFVSGIEPLNTRNTRKSVEDNFRVVSVFRGFETKKDQIVYVGRLSKEKGVETLIKAFGGLVSNAEKQSGGEAEDVLSRRSASPHLRLSALEKLKLVIVGDGVARGELEEMAHGLNIEFVGQKTSDEARHIIAESKAIVSPSACWETFGLAAAEAMSVGTPSVVANVGGLPDIVQDGRFGEVFESGDPESCAAAIERLLSRPDYEEICKVAPQEARAKYSEDANYKQLMEVYCSMSERNKV